MLPIHICFPYKHCLFFSKFCLNIFFLHFQKRSGLVKGETERESTDKKRERRKKKALQKLKYKKKEKELEEKPASGRMKKKEKLEALKKLKQHRNTKIASVRNLITILKNTICYLINLYLKLH